MTAPDPEVTALVVRLGDALGTALRPNRLEDELRSAVSRIRGLYGAAACSFAQVEPDGGTLRFVAADGAGAELIVGVTLPVGRGIAGWVALSGDAISVGDVSRDSRFDRGVAESTDYVPTTMLAAPVVDARGDTAGVIEVLDPADNGATGRDLAVLEVVAGQLASVIRLATVYDALGSGLVRMLADPDGTGDFDDALMTLAADGGLAEVAEAFRDLALAGSEASTLAGRLLVEVAGYAKRRR